MFLKHIIFDKTGFIRIKLFKLHIQICWGIAEILNGKRMNLVFPNQYINQPMVFLSPISKGDLVDQHLNVSNAIYVQNITPKGFAIVTQRAESRMNDIANSVQWFSIGRM